MKEKMKKFMLFFAGLSLMVGPLALGSCSDDLDDGGQPLMNAMVTVKPNADNTEVTLQLDDYTVIHPDNLQKSPFGTKEVRARACLDYKNDDQHVDVVWLDSVLTKRLTKNLGNEEENRKAYGNDPINILNDWITVAEDGYLTLHFATVFGNGSQHKLNLVHRDDVNTPYYFTLYHDAQGDTEGQTGDALVAFKLADWMMAPSDQDYATLTLEWKSYSGTKTTQFKFRQNKGNVSSTSEGH